MMESHKRPDQAGGNFAFGYARVGGKPPSASKNLAGVGVLCLQLLGAGKADQATRGLAFLETSSCIWERPWSNRPMYAWYYITQAKFHAGGNAWKNWNLQFSPSLTRSIIVIPKAIQDPKGRWVDIGYWKACSPDDKAERSYVYNTTLGALMLEVYYRYLPSYKPPEETTPEGGFEDKEKDISVEVN